MVKVPWRYKCSFHWLNNNSLSQWSDKNLSSSFHIPHLCVDFSLQCEPGWQSVMAWWNCVRCCARLPVPGVPEERELQVTLGRAVWKIAGISQLFIQLYLLMCCSLICHLSLLKCSTLMTKVHFKGSYHLSVSCNSSAWIILTSWKCSAAGGCTPSELKTAATLWWCAKCCSAPWELQGPSGENIIVYLLELL